MPEKPCDLQVLVLDEADLLLSYGYEGDLQALQPLVPRSAQCMLMSATTSPEVDRLAEFMLHNSCFLDLSASTSSTPSSAPAITHTFTQVATGNDRLLTVLALLRLNLVKKKVLLFTNSPESAYRVRLLLEAFGTRAGTLVATLPLESRHNAIDQFNAGAFDVLVASEAPKASQAAHNGSTKDAVESGVTRGIDFKGVRTVINVEVPADMTTYTHRVGRTGRAGAEGLAITIFGPEDAAFLDTLSAAMPVRLLPCGLSSCPTLCTRSPGMLRVPMHTRRRHIHFRSPSLTKARRTNPPGAPCVCGR